MPTPRSTPRGTPRATRASVETATPTTATHHKSSDELAVEEAASLLSDGSGSSPRAKRHAALNRAREDAEDSEDKNDDEEKNGSGSGSDAASDSESGSSAGDSDSDSDDSSDSSDSESDSDEEELERQLAAARASAAKTDKKAAAGHKAVFAGALGEDEDGELRFDAEAPKEAPIPDLAVGALPAQVLSFAEDGTARAGPATTSSAADSSEKTGAPELDRGAYQRALSKREKLAQPKKASASELWATLPDIRGNDLEQMKRDYQALALSNTLDPKRFMKGGNRAGKVPAKFQIGTMVDAPRHLQDTTVRKERKYRAGEIVADVVANEQLGSYAKRKFEDLQGKRMHNGRGKGWQKKTKW